jgi:hypothetical protein
VTSQHEDAVLYVGVPDEDLMVETSGEETLVEGAPLAPVQRVDALVVPP